MMQFLITIIVYYSCCRFAMHCCKKRNAEEPVEQGKSAKNYVVQRIKLRHKAVLKLLLIIIKHTVLGERGC